MSAELSDPMQAADAEVSLLGAAMLGADIDTLADIVTAGDFYDPRRGEIWAAIMRVHNAGNRPDVVSVRLAFDETSSKTRKADALELLSMIERAPNAASAAYYAAAVASAAGHRAITKASIQLADLGAQVGDIDKHREQARQIVDEACRGRTVTRARTIADSLPDVIDQAEHGQTGMLSTGWPDLDRVVGGLAPGRLIVVGARPGVGKSLMLSNLALHVAMHHGHAALFASLEMPEIEVAQRMLASTASVNLGSLVDGIPADDPSWDRIAACSGQLAAAPIVIADNADMSVTDIRRAARDIQRTRDDLALICVDYVQLIRTADRDNRASALGEVSRGLKLLARETGACVVAAAQVNREAVKRQGDRPRMSDLRESGAIEADADQVILLHQPEDEIPEIDVVIDKNRHGPKGIASLQVWGHYARLVSVTRGDGE